MLDWIKKINKDYPDFFKEYLLKFEKKSNRFVVLCNETSGLNPTKDVILSMGAFGIIDNSIYIGDNLENEVLKINTPTIDQDSSIITSFLDVKVKHMLNGVTIRYTTNGTDPDSVTSPIYKNTLRLTRNTNLKIKVFISVKGEFWVFFN